MSTEDIAPDDSYFQRLQHSVYANILCPLSSCQLCLLLCGCLPWLVTDREQCNYESMSEPESESEETDLLEPLTAPPARVSTAERIRLMCCCSSGGQGSVNFKDTQKISNT